MLTRQLALPLLAFAIVFTAAPMARAADDALAVAMKTFDKRRYEQAARTLEPALAQLDAARRAQAQLVLGTIYLRSADLHAAFARTGAAPAFDYLDRLSKTGAEGRSRYAPLYLAETQLVRGNAAEAVRYFEQITNDATMEKPAQAFATVGLGSAAWARKDGERARGLWSGIGSSQEVTLARAAAEAQAGVVDAKTSLRLADEASGKRDLSVRARRYLIEIYLAAGAPEKALAVARSADLAAASQVETFKVVKGTAKSIAFYDLALITDLARMYRELARRQLEQASADARVKPTAEYYLAELYTTLGRQDEANKYVQAFLAQPQAPAQYRERTRARQALLAWRQGKRPEAERAWSALADGNDPEVQADVVLACAEAGAECTKPVARLALIAEAGDGKRLRRLHAALGSYYLRKKDYARAITYMEAGRDKSNKNKIEANDPEMLAGLAEAYYRTKKFSEGLEIFFEMSKEFPVVRQVQEAMQGVYAVEQRSAGDVKIF
jgi:hypothetical protein